ncbi:hypothetical protein Alches_12430 [Alicyclobacillus hesperidum subsp. aegles]|nr:hypothetical protein Alches_12430 [Alicyclobacillus hesperidum subsp. aegles]
MTDSKYVLERLMGRSQELQATRDDGDASVNTRNVVENDYYKVIEVLDDW